MPVFLKLILLLLCFSLGSVVSFATEATTLTSNPTDSAEQDAKFHEWCETVGIMTPSARLITTERSVAGRGVFATRDVAEGDVVMAIPENMIFHEYNGATKYPDLGRSLAEDEHRFWSRMEQVESSENQGIKKRGILRRLMGRVTSFVEKKNVVPIETPHVNDEFVEPSDLWQARLTLFSLMACGMQDPETGDCSNMYDSWAPWISSWQRDDLFHSLVASGATYENSEMIRDCAEELHKKLPDVSTITFQAAIDIRLRRLDTLMRIYEKSIALCAEANNVTLKDIVTRYMLMCSRAIEIGDDISAVIPMHDMANHSPNPNLAMGFDGSHFELIALRDIAKDEELFIRYTSNETETWDEIQAAWTFVQWGIPEPKPAKDEL